MEEITLVRKVYARRYAQAIFEIAQERDELDRWRSDLWKIAGLGKDAPFVAVLESPKFHLDDKVRLLSERLGDINPLALNLACLLVTKGRFGMVDDVAHEYQRLLDGYRGIEHAEAVTVIPLGDADKRKLAERLSAVTGKKVVLEAEVDSGLIGGIVVRVGGKLIDGSTRSKLLALKKELVGDRARRLE